ncbi:MAG TPA: hypothetical protein VGB13_06645 [Candidatus Krumholzibacteria bacterium]
MTAEHLRALLLGRRYRHPTDELRLQEEIAAVLSAECIGFEREVVLTPTDRIDFLVGTVGVEIKVKGSAHAVARQLLRYAEHERITELVLFTTRTQIVVPSSLGGKPVHTARYMTL